MLSEQRTLCLEGTQGIKCMQTDFFASKVGLVLKNGNAQVANYCLRQHRILPIILSNKLGMMKTTQVKQLRCVPRHCTKYIGTVQKNNN